MRRFDRDAMTCQLMCGRQRAPNNPYRLCTVCQGRVTAIAETARMKKRKKSHICDPGAPNVHTQNELAGDGGAACARVGSAP